MTACIFFSLFTVQIAIATAPLSTAGTTPVVVSTHKPLTPREIVSVKSKEYGVSEGLMVDVISCENVSWDTTLQSKIKYNFNDPRRGIVFGEREKSYGLVQIHLPDHPYVSYEQATDPEFSIDFMAKNIAEGRLSWWSCAKLLGYVQ